MLGRIWKSFCVACLATLTFATFGVSFAALSKSHDPVVIRNGFTHDYLLLAMITAAVGLLTAAMAIFILTRLFRSRPPAPVSHF